MRRKVKVNFKNTVVKVKENYISLFNTFCLRIGRQVLQSGLSALLNQLFDNFF
jgi:hypothetical protein